MRWKGFVACSLFLFLLFGGWFLNGKVEQNDIGKQISESDLFEIQRSDQRTTNFMPREYIKINKRPPHILEKKEEKTANDEG